MKVNLDDLKIAKEELKKYKRDDKLIIEGKTPVLLSGTIFNLSPSESEYSYIDANPNFKKNLDENSLVDAYTYILHEEIDINAYFNYVTIPSTYDVIQLYRQIYSDSKFKAMIKQQKIDLLYYILNSGGQGNSIKDVCMISAGNSSYNFCGITDFQEKYRDILELNGYSATMQFGGLPSYKQFNEDGFKLTDDVIKYNELKNQIVLNKKLKQEEIYPRNIEISFNAKNDNNINIELYNLITNHIEWSLSELNKYGRDNAMGPQKIK